MLSIIQIVFAAAAVWYASQAAMGFGRDIRRDLFHSVTGFSAREVGQFGAPSLITRTTNDVQQIQMLVVMAVTMMITAPLNLVIGIFFAVREDRAERVRIEIHRRGEKPAHQGAYDQENGSPSQE